jgi:hypothetical protein
MRIVLLLFVSISLAAQDGEVLSYPGIREAYERAAVARASGHDDEYVHALQTIAFESVAASRPAAVTAAEELVIRLGINGAVAAQRSGVTVATDAISLLGEYRLAHGNPDRARELLAFAATVRARSLIETLEGEPIGFVYENLTDALVRARNVRNTFKYLNELDVAEDPNLFRDLHNLARALTQTGYPEQARGVLLILAEEPAAGPFQRSAERALTGR